MDSAVDELMERFEVAYRNPWIRATARWSTEDMKILVDEIRRLESK